MEIHFTSAWAETDDNHFENTAIIKDRAQEDRQITIRLDRAALEYIKKEYTMLSQFINKPGVMEFILKNGQNPPTPHGIESKPGFIAISEPGVRYIQQWMSISKDTDEQ